MKEENALEFCEFFEGEFWEGSSFELAEEVKNG